MANGFDFSEATIGNETRTLDIRHPADDTVIASMELFNIDADKPKAIQRRHEKSLVKRPRGSRIDLEELESHALDILSACVVSWRGVEWQGETLACTPENVKKLLAIKWVREQVEAFVNDVAGFLDRSRTNSGTPATTVSSSTTELKTEGL